MSHHAVIVAALLLAGCATDRMNREFASIDPPEYSSWTRQYSVAAFEREILREDSAARSFEAKGGVFIRALPTPGKWKAFKTEHSAIRSIWRYDFDPAQEVSIDAGESTGPLIEHKRRIGAGFVVIDRSGRMLPFHESLAYMISGVDP